MKWYYSLGTCVSYQENVTVEPGELVKVWNIDQLAPIYSQLIMNIDYLYTRSFELFVKLLDWGFYDWCGNFTAPNIKIHYQIA